MATQTSARADHRRGFSFGSGKSSSHKSSGSKSKIEDKPSTRMNTHADPTKAISELQPSDMALEKSNLQSLRGMQYKDRFGNLITDPDLSNPTRHRFERPLETIRSFEAAINGTYSNRRQSYVRADESTHGGYSRPESYVGDRQGNSYNRGYDTHGQYGRGNQSRPDSYIDAYGGNHNQPSYNQHSRGQRHNPRVNGDQWYGPGQQGYGSQYAGYPSNDVNASPSGSGSGSLSADQLGQSTDPSSVNSSMDHLQNRQKPPGEAYGFNGFGGEPQLDYPQYYGQDQGYADYPGQQGYGQEADYSAPVPAPPPKDTGATLQKKPMPQQKEAKRKSFFKRFSKG